jgi:hypothetical protein
MIHRHAIATPLIVLALLGTLVTGCSSPTRKAAKFMILHTNDSRGYVEPCG